MLINGAMDEIAAEYVDRLKVARVELDRSPNLGLWYGIRYLWSSCVAISCSVISGVLPISRVIARAIHKRSNRSERPFISVNCAAVPSSPIMSELFGHEKGAFTGAVQRRLGRFELAEGGTIFLDEVGDLPMETQIALLRVLQEREFERVGGTEVLRTDVRVISARRRSRTAPFAMIFTTGSTFSR